MESTIFIRQNVLSFKFRSESSFAMCCNDWREGKDKGKVRCLLYRP